MRTVPPPKAQAPIVTTLPPIPPLTFPNVQLAQPKPPAPAVAPTPPEAPPKAPPERVHHRRPVHKPEEPEEPETPPAPTASGASVLGQLSANDATANPRQDVETQRIIEETEDRLKKIPSDRQARHKTVVAQIESFLKQARQAAAMNDVVGAQTLANKAKILLDEVSK